MKPDVPQVIRVLTFSGMYAFTNFLIRRILTINRRIYTLRKLTDIIKHFKSR